MSKRKNWTPEEDEVLRKLRLAEGQKKWSIIAKKMAEEYNLHGRTGKQCRQRYHNKLNAVIADSDWTSQQDNILYRLHEKHGNKWSIISNYLPGKSENCVKNHFYSKLRKSLRKLNKLVEETFKKDICHEIKVATLYRIIEHTQSRFKNNPSCEQQLSQFCSGIKNRLFIFEDRIFTDSNINEFMFDLVQDIQLIQKCSRKMPLKVRKIYNKPIDSHYIHKHSQENSPLFKSIPVAYTLPALPQTPVLKSIQHCKVNQNVQYPQSIQLEQLSFNQFQMKSKNLFQSLPQYPSICGSPNTKPIVEYNQQSFKLPIEECDHTIEEQRAKETEHYKVIINGIDDNSISKVSIINQNQKNKIEEFKSIQNYQPLEMEMNTIPKLLQKISLESFNSSSHDSEKEPNFFEDSYKYQTKKLSPIYSSSNESNRQKWQRMQSQFMNQILKNQRYNQKRIFSPITTTYRIQQLTHLSPIINFQCHEEFREQKWQSMENEFLFPKFKNFEEE